MGRTGCLGGQERGKRVWTAVWVPANGIHTDEARRCTWTPNISAPA